MVEAPCPKRPVIGTISIIGPGQSFSYAWAKQPRDGRQEELAAQGIGYKYANTVSSPAIVVQFANSVFQFDTAALSSNAVHSAFSWSEGGVMNG